MSTTETTPQTVDPREAGSQPAQYPTAEELRHNPQSSPAFLRLVWSFNGSLETAISVMASAHNVDVLEPYFQPTAGGASPWHAISKSPATHPPVSAIMAIVREAEDWESNWEDFHEHHSDPYEHTESEDLQYGELSDYDPEDEGEPPHLLVCCGTKRPRNKASGVLVTASQSGPGFVTIHDYLTTVHPWLMRNRDDILGAINCREDLHEPENMDLVVDNQFPTRFTIKEKSDWVNELSRR